MSATTSTGDGTMLDAPNATTATVTILDRVKSFVSDLSELVDRTELTQDDVMSSQLRRLKESSSIPVPLSETSGEAPMFVCDLSHDDGTSQFLNRDMYTNKLYIRAGYDNLFDLILRYWKERTSSRVTLLGNAGTGKRWYQIYVLRRLLQRNHNEDEHPYKFVVRQVGDKFFLIDLKECKGYIWLDVEKIAEDIIDEMDETLYFYEPANCKEQPPLFVDAIAYHFVAL